MEVEPGVYEVTATDRLTGARTVKRVIVGDGEQIQLSFDQGPGEVGPRTVAWSADWDRFYCCSSSAWRSCRPSGKV